MAHHAQASDRRRAVAAIVVAGGAIDAALAQGSPFGVGAPKSAPPPPLDRHCRLDHGQAGRVLQRPLRRDPRRQDRRSALWVLFGLSFAYGVFHAAGPGHGKAVISSYVVANRETWWRGVVLSFASAMVQAPVAVAVVGIAAVLLNATAATMKTTVYWIEVVSYLLIIAIGLRLVWAKGRAAICDVARHSQAEDRRRRRHARPSARPPCITITRTMITPTMIMATRTITPRSRPCAQRITTTPIMRMATTTHTHDHAHCDHDHGSAWSHAHAPEPSELAGPGGWKRGLTAIVAVGLRPCSGAILVLVFTLAQGLFWAGVVATFVMGLGTAITVATIATLVGRCATTGPSASPRPAAATACCSCAASRSRRRC